MTVRREAQRTFDVDGERLVEAARRVLDDDPIYRDTTEDGRSFTTTVKPNPFVLETAMRVCVRLDEGDVGAKPTVRVTSVSPPSVHADVFGFYDRYLQDFLAALARRLEDPGPEGATPQGPRGAGLRGLWSTWHGRHLLASGFVLVLLLTVLPVGLALAGFGGFALNIAFFPFAWAAGFGLARFSGMVRRRLGLVAAVPAAVFGFVAVAALLVVVGLFVSGALLPGRSSSLSMVGSGLVFGIFWASFSRSKPDGFDGEVSLDRDVRGPRGYFGGVGRALSGGPMFRGNLAFMGLLLSGGLLLTALGAFALIRGGASPPILSVALLGLGNLLLGVAETVPLGPTPITVATRVAGLLAGLAAFATLLLELA